MNTRGFGAEGYLLAEQLRWIRADRRQATTTLTWVVVFTICGPYGAAGIDGRSRDETLSGHRQDGPSRPDSALAALPQ